jgi:hypothetical protein
VQLEDARSDEAGKGGRENVASVEDGDARGDFRAGVKVGDDEEGARVVGGLDDTKEEAGLEVSGVETWREGRK